MPDGKSEMRILITGGTGALGRALVERLIHEPLIEAIRILSRDEHKVARLAELYPDPNPLRLLIGDVRDRDRMRTACYGVDAVIHAAALKRVDQTSDVVEMNKTNVYGTCNITAAAMEAGVRKVLVVSSDKAVMPTNAYGTTKMMAECHSVEFNSYSMPRGTAISIVRYGNVAKSTGSIYHIWKQCFNDGKRLPLTNFDMTRFHISMEQAVEFCISSLRHMQGGEIFVPDLPAYRLCDVGDAMAKNAGICGERYGDIFECIGLRTGGEKLAERLLSDEELHRTLWQDNRYIVTPSKRSWSASPYRGKPLQGDPHLISSWPARWMTIEQLQMEFA